MQGKGGEAGGQGGQRGSEGSSNGLTSSLAGVRQTKTCSQDKNLCPTQFCPI